MNQFMNNNANPNFNFNINNNNNINYMNKRINNFNNNINNNANNNVNNNANNNVNNNFNNNFNNNNFNNNGNNIYRNFTLYNNNKEPKPILPRSNTLINVPNFEKVNNGKLINIVFAAGTGLRVNIPVPINTTIEYLLKVYARRLGISENVLGTGIVFLYDALYMEVKDKRTVGEVFHGKQNQYVVTVVDAANVLAA